MKTAWKGQIGFSFLHIPVRLGGATGDSDAVIRAHQYSAKDRGKIRYKRISEVTGEEVAWKDVVRGFDAPDGGIVFLTDEEVEQAYGKSSRFAELIFTDASRIPDIARSKSFLVQPDTGGERGYSLLASTLLQTGKIGITLIGMRQRKRLCEMRPTEDGYLVISQVEWPSDVRKPDFAAPAATFSPEEEKLAAQLIEQLTDSTWNYDTQVDDSQVRLNETIHARVTAGESVSPVTTPGMENPAGQALSLMEQLRASVEASRPRPAKAVRKPRARKPKAAPAKEETVKEGVKEAAA